MQAYIRLNNFGRMLGMDFHIESAGKAVYSMQIEERHLATPAASHGGAIAALMDAALGTAGLSAVCELGRVVSTVDMNMHFTKPARNGDLLTATAQVISQGNRLLVVEARIHNQHQELVASGSGTFNTYPQDKAGF